MYTVLLQKDNTVHYTNITGVKIIQNSTSNTIQFLSPIMDDEGNDLTDAIMQIEYVYPSKEYGIKYLSPTSTNYKTGYELQYLLPMDAEMTKEAGTIQFVVTFLHMVESEDGISVQEYVNKHLEGIIPIEAGSKWQMYVPDDLLLPIDQRILKMEAQQALLTALAGKLEAATPADVTLENEKIQLINNKKELVGEGVNVHDLSPIIGPDIAGTDGDGVVDGVTDLDTAMDEAEEVNT